MYSKGFLAILYFLLVSQAIMCTTAKKIGDSPGSWYDKLPPCPCENPDRNGVRINDGWAKDAGNIKKYHKGAAASFRSYPPVPTSEGRSGQQCCYDQNGKLITSGSGAGTPDKVSTCKGENSKGEMKIRYRSLLQHYFKDVRPWKRLGGVDSGWVRYNRLWVPSKGKGCS